MSNPAAPAQAEPQVTAPSPAPAPAAAPEVTQKRPTSLAELDAQIDAERAQIEAKASDAVAQIQAALTPAPEAAPEAIAPETAEAAPETPAETPEEPAAPKRIRMSHLSPEARAQIAREVAVLTEMQEAAPGHPFTLSDARARIEEMDAEQAARAEIEAEQNEASAAPIAAREARIAEIEGLIDKMAEEQSLITPEYRALQRELDRLKDEQRDARTESRLSAQQRQEANLRSYREDHARTLQAYPTANQTDQPLGMLVEQLISDWKLKGDSRWNAQSGVSNVTAEAVSILRDMGVPDHVIRHGRDAKPPAGTQRPTAAAVPSRTPPNPVASPAKAGGAASPQISVADLARAKSTPANLALLDKALGWSDDAPDSIRGGFTMGG